MIVEFRCHKAGHTTEKIMSRDEAAGTLFVICPLCPTVVDGTPEESLAYKVEFSQTAPPKLIGSGFYKESATSASANGGLSEAQLAGIEKVNP